MSASFGTRVFFFGALATLLVSVLPVSANNVAVGVQAGDWAKYGEISVKYQSDPPEPPPRSLVDFNNTEWIMVEVQNVFETNITAIITTHLKNQTEKTETLTWNITDRTRFWQNLWYKPDLCVIEANLSKGDLINMESLRITETMSLKYASRTREVNRLNKTFLQGKSIVVTADAYWDKTTGILCELNEVRIVGMPGLGIFITTTMKIAETNLWKPSSIWTESLLWLIAGVVVAAIAVSAIWVWRRRKVALHKEEAVSAPTP